MKINRVAGLMMIADFNNRDGLMSVAQIENTSLSQTVNLGALRNFRLATINCCRKAAFSAAMAFAPFGCSSLIQT